MVLQLNLEGAASYLRRITKRLHDAILINKRDCCVTSRGLGPPGRVWGLSLASAALQLPHFDHLGFQLI